MFDSAGFSLVEIVVVLAIAAVLLGVSIPSLGGVSRTAALSSGLTRISAAAVRAQSLSSQYGRTAYFVLDAAADRIRIEVDTTLDGGGPPVPLLTLDLWRDLRLDLRASEPVVCLDPRGITAGLPGCPGTGAVIWLERGGRIDSLVVGPTGRVMR